MLFKSTKKKNNLFNNITQGLLGLIKKQLRSMIAII